MTISRSAEQSFSPDCTDSLIVCADCVGMFGSLDFLKVRICDLMFFKGNISCYIILLKSSLTLMFSRVFLFFFDAVRRLSNLDFNIFKNLRLEEKKMAYNNGRENRKWLIWKEAEEKILREHGVDETTTPQIRTDDRADFNSNRRFYHWTSDFGEYLEEMADREQNTELKTVADLLDEIEDETLYRALLTVDRRTLQIILLKMQGYSTKEIAPLVGLTIGAIYARLDHLRKKLRKIL